MSNDYTPTTEQVRGGFTWDYSPENTAELGTIFDRWLAAHDAEVIAKARSVSKPTTGLVPPPPKVAPPAQPPNGACAVRPSSWWCFSEEAIRTVALEEAARIAEKYPVPFNDAVLNARREISYAIRAAKV